MRLDEQCQGLECDQIACPPDGETTSLTGTVQIPSGEFDIPNVSVYIPNGDLEDLPEETACMQCEDMLSGDPLVQDVTDVDGNFTLPNVPVADEVPLVMQSGKWRRKVEISGVEPCTTNEITGQDDQELTRLPRNQSEGNIPKIAVTTGGWDDLECLTYNLGLDDEEFTRPEGDGKVNFFTASGGSTNYASDFNNGEYFPPADEWWHDLDNLLEYDIIMHSCEGTQNTQDKSDAAYEAFRDFAHEGGRAFLSHWENEWLEHAPEDLSQVTTWGGTSATSMAEVNTSFEGGQNMYDWMHNYNALDANDQFNVNEARFTIGNLDEELTELWLHYADAAQTPLYFAFNTPVEADEEDQCGRIVFSDLHVSSGSGANFPSLCNTDLSSQEKALVYMFFDLTACLAPECEPLTCEDVENNCGFHPDECGGTLDCGECCVPKHGSCDNDDDCCEGLWCDADTGECTDECRSVGETCTDSEQCCSGDCAMESGQDIGSCSTG